MASGIPKAFFILFRTLGIPWTGKPMCPFLIIGALTTAITWTLGLSRGLLKVAEEGRLPVFWGKRNRDGIPPVRILRIQALISSCIALFVFVMPDIGSAFWR